MTIDEIEKLRRLIDTHRRNSDPLIVIKIDDLALLLDSYEWFANPERKPRLRVKAEPAQ